MLGPGQARRLTHDGYRYGEWFSWQVGTEQGTEDEAVATADHVLTIQTADQQRYANVLLTVGVRMD